jgi:hypothetical protein
MADEEADVLANLAAIENELTDIEVRRTSIIPLVPSLSLSPSLSPCLSPLSFVPL